MALAAHCDYKLSQANCLWGEKKQVRLVRLLAFGVCFSFAKPVLGGVFNGASCVALLVVSVSCRVDETRVRGYRSLVAVHRVYRSPGVPFTGCNVHRRGGRSPLGRLDTVQRATRVNVLF